MQMRSGRARVALAGAVLLLISFAGFAQRFRIEEPEAEAPRPNFASLAEFHFIRLEYTDLAAISPALELCLA